MLSALIWLPLLGAGVIGLYPGQLNAARARLFALLTAIAILVLTIVILSQFNLANPGLQMQEFLPWLSTLGLNYSLAIDGLSLPMLVLSSILTLVVASNGNLGLKEGQTLERPRLFYSLLLLANAGLAGAFMAQNLLFFFLCYEVELIPFYLMIVIWGGVKREYAATKFLIYTALSGILILAAFLGMNWLTHAASFEYNAINTTNLATGTQLILLTVLLLGFGIKIPLVPLHTWLPDAYVESSAPVSILLGGLLSKLGTYGLIRFAVELFPETWASVAPTMAVIGAISIMYGALAAIAQHDIKRMVAYSSIGHMGYVMLGIAALTPLSMVGAVSQMVSHGLILAMLFYLVGIVESVVGTRELEELNGLLNPIRGIPLTASLLVFASMASAGIPGMVGFIPEFLVFQGSYRTFPIQTLLAILGTGLTAVYFVILLNRTCFGRLDNFKAYYRRVTLQEHAPALALAVLILWLGIQPSWLVRWSEQTTTALVVSAFPGQTQIAQKQLAQVPTIQPPIAQTPIAQTPIAQNLSHPSLPLPSKS
ncbi:MAG: NADH-quinone oxidoreductase subunit M [Synechococcales bacterium]|nr:NADH-quinone oxidoreductase subunit M [Synechococcales bacterium]